MLHFLLLIDKSSRARNARDQGREVTTEEPLNGHHVQPIRCLIYLQGALYSVFFRHATTILNLKPGILSQARLEAAVPAQRFIETRFSYGRCA
jgi:hypothetical protein